MKISRRDWQRYIDKLSALNNKAAELMKQWIDKNGTANVDEMIRYAYALSTKYGEAAAALACQMYDATAEFDGASIDPAEPAETATYSEVARNINGVVGISDKLIPQVVSRLTKQAGADTTIQNAKRDHAQFAWITFGDTCPYCMDISAEGWKYATNETVSGNHADHIHGNCDCQFQIRFNKETTVSGYNPEMLKNRIERAEGDTTDEKINSIRRIQYQESKEDSPEA